MEKTSMSKVWKIVLLIVALAMAALVSGLVVAHNVKPVEVPGPTQFVNVSVPGPVQYVNVSVPGPVQVITQNVSVQDDSFNTMACDRLHYTVVADCVRDVKAEDAALQAAFSEINSNYAQELKNANLVAKEKYADLVKVYTEYKDVNVTESSFDNAAYSFEIKVKYNDIHADQKSYAMFDVSVQDGVASVDSVSSI